MLQVISNFLEQEIEREFILRPSSIDIGNSINITPNISTDIII